MTRPSTSELTRFASSLADAARDVIQRYRNFGVDVEVKTDESPVTLADRGAEQAMRALIEERFPEHGIAGEEYGTIRGKSEFVWSLDPIDGTKAFITGSPRFGTLIGLVESGKPVLGLIDMPVLDERWIGGRDYITRMNGAPVEVRACPDLSDAILAATSPSMFKGMEKFMTDSARQHAIRSMVATATISRPLPAVISISASKPACRITISLPWCLSLKPQVAS